MNLRISGILAFGLLPIVIGIGTVCIPIVAVHTSLDKTVISISLSLLIVFSVFFIGSIIYLSKLLGKSFIYLSLAVSFFYIMSLLMYYELIISFEQHILKALVYYILLAFSIFGLGSSLWLYFRKLYKSKNIYHFKVASVSFLIFGILLFVPLVATFIITIFWYISGMEHGTGIVIPVGFGYSLLYSISFQILCLLVGVFSSITGFLKLKN